MGPGEIREQMNAIPAVFVAKAQSPLMRLISVFLGDSFRARFWTTWRLPMQRYVRIGYPTTVQHPEMRSEMCRHELVHARDFARWWGPWWMLACLVFPVPVLFSGRWFLERHAYLGDIKAGTRTIDDVVYGLWRGYGWPWPKFLMRRWFERELAR